MKILHCIMACERIKFACSLFVYTHSVCFSYLGTESVEERNDWEEESRGRTEENWQHGANLGENSTSREWCNGESTGIVLSICTYVRMYDMWHCTYVVMTSSKMITKSVAPSDCCVGAVLCLCYYKCVMWILGVPLWPATNFMLLVTTSTYVAPSECFVFIIIRSNFMVHGGNINPLCTVYG